MSPHEILGIPPTASIDEAESAYRALLRECHPDLHAHAGPEAVAWAERRTRALNAAIQAIRAQSEVFVPPAEDGFARAQGFASASDADWFGNPLDARPSIPCVFCGLTVENSRSYRVHLLLDHAFVERARRRRVHPAYTTWLAWMPAPAFWSVVVFAVYAVALFSTLGDSGVALVGWWAGVAAILLFLPFAYRAQRNRRF
jgi:hypothetical protein